MGFASLSGWNLSHFSCLDKTYGHQSMECCEGQCPSCSEESMGSFCCGLFDMMSPKEALLPGEFGSPLCRLLGDQDPGLYLVPTVVGPHKAGKDLLMLLSHFLCIIRDFCICYLFNPFHVIKNKSKWANNAFFILLVGKLPPFAGATLSLPQIRMGMNKDQCQKNFLKYTS